MTWLITGGSGQLGIALSQELGERGLNFHAWNSQDLDITKGPIVRDVIMNLSPKIIVNCAAWTDVDGAEDDRIRATRVNRDGAENIALAAKRCGAKLIHISTDYVFSGENKKPWQVNDTPNPQSVYGSSKADGEKRVLSVHPDNSSIVRTAWLYSQWGKNFAKTMTRLALKGEGEVRVVNDQVGQPTSATDLAKQLVELGLSSATPGIYHGTNSGTATWYEFAQEIFGLSGAEVGRIKSASTDELIRPAKRPTYSVLSHGAWANTSVQPLRDWQTALAEVLPAIISAVLVEE